MALLPYPLFKSAFSLRTKLALFASAESLAVGTESLPLEVEAGVPKGSAAASGVPLVRTANDALGTSTSLAGIISTSTLTYTQSAREAKLYIGFELRPDMPKLRLG